ncbi:MAG TPA: 16S rRNA (cytidine(1402)-2'-O)-methyltransferase [Pyrinomonadaceae bacterium]|nr:16S rRNA (cytidine(1402)-2'-O)-methyltransferase [Pyrinomonadaceae bacterium]
MPQCEAVPGTLYIVATPIGNLDDITARALRVLREVDLIACEDTRHTRVLLNHFGIKTRTISYHEHNERERAEQLCKFLAEGQSIAIVSDAGTPLISDPGFHIVRAAIEQGIEIISVPGPAAFVSALVASGLACDQFFFAGFLPARAKARRDRLEELRALPATLIFYEAPHRIGQTLKDALEILGDREAVVARELTKIHEQYLRGSLSVLVERFRSTDVARGEIVLMISGFRPERAAVENVQSKTSEDILRRMNELENEGLNSKEALKKAAREFGVKRAEAYRLMVAQKNLRNK